MSGLSDSIEAIFPLSPTQEGMLYHTLNSSDSSVYVGQHIIDIEGIDVDLLRKAWLRLIEKYSSLRSVFVWEELSQPVQLVFKHIDMKWLEIDCRDDLEKIQLWCKKEIETTFHVSEQPPSRVTFLRVADNRYTMIWTRHHLLMDGWSAHIILHELQNAYTSLVSGKTWKRRELSGFSDYIAWLQHQDTHATETYWQKLFANKKINPGLELIRSAAQKGSRARRIRRLLDVESTAHMTISARQNRFTLSTLVHAAWASVLFSCNDTFSLIFGSTNSGRPVDLKDHNAIVGNFINTIPLIVDDDQTTSLLEWLNALQIQIQESSGQGHLSNRKILKTVGISPGTTLFDSIVVFMNYPKNIEQATELEYLQTEYHEHSHYPFALLIVPGDQLEVIAIHDKSQIGSTMADKLLDSVVLQLQKIPDHINGSSTWFLNSARPKSSELFHTPLTVEVHNVLELFLHSVKESPESIAVCDTEKRLSYIELNYAAANLAKLFIKEGIVPGDAIVLLMPRKIDGLVCIWASLFCGANYVPISPGTPVVRLNAIINQTGARLLVATETSLDIQCAYLQVDSYNTDQVKFDVVDDDVNRIVYQILTSGSTGEARCVPVTHSNLANSLAARLQYYGNERQIYGLMSPFAFDSSVAGIFWMAATGGCLALVSERSMHNPEELVRDLEKLNVSVLLTLPSVYRAILDIPCTPLDEQLKTVIVAGEPCSNEIPLLHFERFSMTLLVNEYGPTEATVWCCARTYSAFSGSCIRDSNLSIGRAIPGVQLQILDRLKRPVSKGVTGELYIGGAIVTESNQTNGFYATGDLVSENDDGSIQFRGRRDNQVKIRGHRVSLAEIEATIVNESDIEACAVLMASVESESSLERLNSALQTLPMADALALLQEVESTNYA